MQDAAGTLRAFIAIPLPDDLHQGLSSLSFKLQDKLKAGRTKASWVNPETIHITLKFLGSIDETIVAPILTGLRDAVSGTQAFQISIGGLGVFPNMNNPRVIWVGVQRCEKDICVLQRRVEEPLVSLGFESEKREFSPHLTLARIKSLGSRGEVLRAIRDLQSTEVGEVDVDHVCLMKSTLTPKGAIYDELGSVRLKGFE